MPLDFNEGQRRVLSNKLMLQAPKDLAPSQLARIRRDLDHVVNGLPGDVFMSLDALRLLAEQGNDVAARLFFHECQRLGLTTRTYSFR